MQPCSCGFSTPRLPEKVADLSTPIEITMSDHSHEIHTLDSTWKEGKENLFVVVWFGGLFWLFKQGASHFEGVIGNVCLLLSALFGLATLVNGTTSLWASAWSFYRYCQIRKKVAVNLPSQRLLEESRMNLVLGVLIGLASSSIVWWFLRRGFSHDGALASIGVGGVGCIFCYSAFKIRREALKKIPEAIISEALSQTALNTDQNLPALHAQNRIREQNFMEASGGSFPVEGIAIPENIRDVVSDLPRFEGGAETQAHPQGSGGGA